MTFPTPVPQVLGCSAELRRLQAQHWEESRLADAAYAAKDWRAASLYGSRVAALVRAIEAEDRRCRGWAENCEGGAS